MAVPAMVKNPHAGMVKNRPQGGGYLNSYFYKLLFLYLPFIPNLPWGGRYGRV
jgi:hypothetical protein